MKYNTQVDNSHSYDSITHYVEELDQPFTISDIAQRISSIKHNKSPGYNTVYYTVTTLCYVLSLVCVTIYFI